MKIIVILLLSFYAVLTLVTYVKKNKEVFKVSLICLLMMILVTLLVFFYKTN